MNKNYKLELKQLIKEKNATGYMYKHISNANIIFIENNDENRVFSISFKTPVKDNTGVAHALEHVILTGSKKYIIKDPFNELLKSSLYTYLNAMTFKDKTMYPVASYDEDEFKKLMDVYLDAVFNPLLRKEMFLQEGVNYKIEDGKVQGFGGIVYNEMKGVYSDPIELMENATYENLFKTTHYKYDSGGNPKYIEKLTYEHLKNFYKENYKASNCYIYLYGNLDIDYYLDYLDNEYLKYFKPSENISYEKENFDINNLFIETQYDLDKNDDIYTQYLSASFIIGDSTDNKLMLSMDILIYYLFSSTSSPVKEELLKEGYGKDIVVSFNKTIINPVLNIFSKHTNKDIIGFKNIIMKKLKYIVDNRIDTFLMNSCINKIEFLKREENYGYRPKGLAYNIFLMGSWLNNKNPFYVLEPFKIIEEIRNQINNNYFENIINEYFINNKYVVYNTLIPKATKKEKTNNTNKMFNEEQLLNIKNEMENLKLFQNSKDKEEDIKKIKPIKIENIKRKIELVPSEIINIKDTKVIYQDLNTDGIFYLDLMFETNHIDEDKISYLGILSSVLSKIGTKTRTSYELLKQKNCYFGGISFTFETLKIEEEIKEYLKVKIKGMYRNINDIFEITEDIIKNTNVYDTDKIVETINSLISRYKKDIESNGHTYAINRAKSYFDIENTLSEKITGLDFYIFINNLLKDKNIKEKLSKNLQFLINNIFVKNNQMVSLTCEQSAKDEILNKVANLYNNLFDLKTKDVKPRTCNENTNEIFKINSNVMYNVMIVDLNKINVQYDGAMAVLSTIITNDYLQSEIRLKNGAYGCGSRVNKKGKFIFHSYRDPNMHETIDIFKNIANFIKNLKLEEEELNKYIIGTINKIDKPVSIRLKGSMATRRSLLGITEADIQKTREQILDTSVDSIKSFVDIFENICENSCFTILGNSDIIDTNVNKSNYFINIKNELLF